MAQLRWRCRRGMKELDLLLLKYVDSWYVDDSQLLQQAFKRLLSMPDPEIMDLLTRRRVAEDEDLVLIIERLLNPGSTD
ncbi:MAG: succinate dehydrogenase assembly factor 2 [Gammaproteobacteria bacterium]